MISKDRQAIRSYEGVRVGFLTRHGKEALVQGPLQTELGCTLVHTEAFDTDSLGTFSREIARPGSATEAGRKKAMIAMDLTGAAVGLGSEGSFIPDPYTGMLSWNVELLVWVDQQRRLEVVGIAQGPARSFGRTVRTENDLEHLIRDADFPDHHLMIRPDDEHHPLVFKNLRDEGQLLTAFHRARNLSRKGEVFAEVDLRAYANPTRQKMIAAAASNLAKRLTSFCPKCGSVGFWVVGYREGLPCMSCSAPTRLPVAERWACPSCQLNEERPVSGSPNAPPERCHFCNP